MSENSNPIPQNQPHLKSDADEARELIAKLPAVKWKAIVAVVIVVLAGLGALFLLGFMRERKRISLADEAAQRARQSLQTVSVVRPAMQPKTSDLVLPANAVALQTTLIFPRAGGYLKELHADIGDRVEAGQLLAVIDAPETDAQLSQARAAVLQAKANIDKSKTDLDFSQATLKRFEGFFTTGGVTQQQLDQTRNQNDSARAALELANASLAAAEANVQRLEALQGFEKVVAPFKGTIVTRNYDLGALLSATPAPGAREMFRIDGMDTLRVFVECPQSSAPLIQVGQTAQFIVRDYPNRTFAGKISRSADAVDPVTRTQRFQIDVPNGDGSLRAGMYGQVRFRLTQDHPTLLVPVSALVYNADGLQVAVIVDGKVNLRHVTTGRDFGDEIEITQGLSENADVVSNPGQRLVQGAEVRIAGAQNHQQKITAGNQEAMEK